MNGDSREAAAGRREFWIRVDAGLCNRLRVLLSAIAFSEATRRRLVVCWPVTSAWRRRLAGDVAEVDRFEAALSDLWRHPFQEVGVAEWAAMKGARGVVESPFPPDPESGAEVLCLATIYGFHERLPGTPVDSLARMRLRPELQESLDRTMARWPSPDRMVGVHVRSRAAHEKTLEESPLCWFERRMRDIATRHPEVRFFLSTDDLLVSKRLRATFPGKVDEQCAPPGYNTLAGIRKGLVDLYLLARTRFILGSHWSSFSDMAVTMQGHIGYEDSHNHVGTVL